jgi:hypothetical protein
MPPIFFASSNDIGPAQQAILVDRSVLGGSSACVFCDIHEGVHPSALETVDAAMPKASADKLAAKEAYCEIESFLLDNVVPPIWLL